MKSKLDYRTLLIMLGALSLGLVWAAFNLNQAGPVRNDSTVRNLVWTVFAAPASLWLGWLVARRHELALASFSCFCLYFFTFFVAQRIESLLLSPAEASASGHALYFNLVLTCHLLGGAGLSFWRAWPSRGTTAIPA
ncbi:MAG: hypothetical protein AB4911_15290 [Oscillochloridaceae bacterium umkhey_bin13]